MGVHLTARSLVVVGEDPAAPADQQGEHADPDEDGEASGLLELDVEPAPEREQEEEDDDEAEQAARAERPLQLRRSPPMTGSASMKSWSVSSPGESRWSSA